MKTVKFPQNYCQRAFARPAHPATAGCNPPDSSLENLFPKPKFWYTVLMSSNLKSEELTPRSTRGLAVAYFTMEIAAAEGIPTYAGGLGILAGDLMKSCADLSVKAACISVCWKFGYLHQSLNENGSQKYDEVRWDPSTFLKKLPENWRQV